MNTKETRVPTTTPYSSYHQRQSRHPSVVLMLQLTNVLSHVKQS